MDKVFELLIKIHPDSLIRLEMCYSPGIPDKVKPFYSAVVLINGAERYYSSEYSKDTTAALQVLERDLEKLNEFSPGRRAHLKKYPDHVGFVASGTGFTCLTCGTMADIR